MNPDYITLLNGRVLVDGILKQTNLVLKNGFIDQITNQNETFGTVITLTADHIILPSLIDLHTHLRTPGYYPNINLVSELKAALHGGYQTVCCMANTQPALDNQLTIRSLKAKIKQLDHPVQVLIWSALTKQLAGTSLVDIKSIKRDVLGFSDDGYHCFDQTIIQVFCKRFSDQLWGIHLEASNNIWGNSRAWTDFTKLTWAEQQKQEPELQALLRHYRNAQMWHYPRLHLHHLSLASSINWFNLWKKTLPYDQISCEVTPHHLLLDQQLFWNSPPGWLKVNPPLRSVTDRLALIAAVQADQIDCLATDHAPHPADNKNTIYDHAKPGFSGLELVLPLMYTYFIKPNIITWKQLIKLLVIRPAQIARITVPQIIRNAPAHLVIINTQKYHQVQAEKLASGAGSTPFNQWWLTGWPEYHLLRGQVYHFHHQ